MEAAECERVHGVITRVNDTSGTIELKLNYVKQFWRECLEMMLPSSFGSENEMNFMAKSVLIK